MPFERPRVRAEGPGGEEVKQGARIACLDCRSAKIRCSAPTDGKVPCKRCARHGRECVFEKHRRGRKPGRTNNLKSLGGSEMDSADFSAEFSSDTSVRSVDHHRGPPAGSYPSLHNGLYANPPFHPHHSSSGGAGGGGNAWRVHDGRMPSYNEDPRNSEQRREVQHRMPSSSSLKSSYMRPPPTSPPMSSQQGREQHRVGSGGYFAKHSASPYTMRMDADNPRQFDLHLGHSSSKGGVEHGYHGSRFSSGVENTYSPPSSGLQSSSLGSGTTPGRSWLDFPTPGTRSLLSPSHMISTAISTFPSSNGSVPSAWPGSAITSPHKRKGPTDYFAGALPPVLGLDAEEEARKKPRHLHRESAERGANSADSASHQSPASQRSSVRQLYVEEDEEEVDHMDEDEVGGVQDGDVLSTPLRLLAHASDAALALRQAKGDEGATTNRSTSVGAATMGLVSPPVPSLPAPRRWFDSGRLPSMMLDRSSTPTPSASGLRGLLPRLTNVVQRRDEQRASTREMPTLISSGAFVNMRSSATALPPPILGSLGRSRSYTAVNAVSSRSSYIRSPEQHMHPLTDAPSIVAPVTQVERRAEVLGIHTDVNGRQIEVVPGEKSGELSVTATTLDPDAWEYRNGRVRTRKSISAGAGGTHSGTAATSHEDDTSKAAITTAANTAAGKDESMNTSLEEASSEVDKSATSLLVAATKQRAFRKRLDSLDSGNAQLRRWEVVRRRPQRKDDEDAVSDGSSEESEKLGASHQDFFSMSIFHSKMDIDLDLDPIEAGIVELHELEKLFDVFFARINPLLTMFDPFLHSVTYVRHRSALLTTVIAALAARLLDTARSPELASALENHWRTRLLPEALLGGYKSVELSQAFLVLALYHKPTNRLSEDRSWQYLGFAVRIATEIGVNRLTQPNDEVKNNEQVRRRMRNRARLWICLWLTDRSMGLQTGRPFTISEDDMIANSDLWHREAFALPEDARLVSLVKLLRVMTTYCQAFAQIIKQHGAVSRFVDGCHEAQESVKMLNLCRLQATTELERWKDIWCVEALDESRDGRQSLAISTFLDKWRPRAKIDGLYSRLHLNSIVLEGMERHQRLLLGLAKAKEEGQPEVVEAKEAGEAEETKKADGDEGDLAQKQKQEESSTFFQSRLEETRMMIEKVALDCWDTTLKMIDILLTEVPEEDLAAGPNALSVNVIYGALAALRLSNPTVANHADHPWADRSAIMARCKSLADALIKAGRTPEHRNGAAAPFGTYLKGIIHVWEAEKVGVQNCKTNGADQEANVDADPAKTPTVSPKRPTLVSAPASHHTPNQTFHSVGDDVWGASRSSRKSEQNATVTASHDDALSMDRMWDYLTTYPDSASTFPMSLWQPQLASNQTSAFVPASAGNTADVLAAAAAAAGTGGQLSMSVKDTLLDGTHNLVENNNGMVALTMLPQQTQMGL